jgi:hypothetical protein
MAGCLISFVNIIGDILFSLSVEFISYFGTYDALNDKAALYKNVDRFSSLCTRNV